MQEQNKARARRVRNLVAIFSLTAIVFSVSTYAWFIGMRTVSVDSFDVEIAATDSLSLSLDGTSWDTTVAITKDTLDDITEDYATNSNSWGGKGLIPMSSVGEMDSTASRMKLFEKASLTATAGGYRLLASRVNNFKVDAEEPSGFVVEQDGYVAFDLFVRNLTGTQYIGDLEPLDEEAIYLTTESEVSVAEIGGVANTGIENSVRVAFAQIGRVAGTVVTDTTVQGITCSDNETDGVTGICRTAQIWEPNDKLHVPGAIGWYDTACKVRVEAGTDITLDASYDLGTERELCGTVVNGTANETYAIKNAITSADNVDIYDGGDYNTYDTYNSDDALTSTLLYAYPTFTDTMKSETGTARPQFMTLAPNSITKVRIYIYIEGQDIDNYDFASIGKKISVKFGFTKERFIETDTGYTGPALNQGDGPSTTTTTSE